MGAPELGGWWWDEIGVHSLILTDDVLLVFTLSAGCSVHSLDAVCSCKVCIAGAQNSLGDDNCASSNTVVGADRQIFCLDS